MADEERPFWSIPVDETLRCLGSAPNGLGDEEARRRRGKAKLNLRGKGDGRFLGDAGLLLNQFKSPIEGECARSLRQGSVAIDSMRRALCR